MSVIACLFVSFPEILITLLKFGTRNCTDLLLFTADFIHPACGLALLSLPLLFPLNSVSKPCF